MAGTTWAKFFWADWSNDRSLRLCTLAARGLWMQCLCLAAEGEPIGYLTIQGKPLDASDLAVLAGSTTEAEVANLLDELERKGVFSRDSKGRIYSRRMVRDAQRFAEARKFGKLGGNPSLSKGEGKPHGVNPPHKGGDKPPHKLHKPEAKKPFGARARPLPEEGAGGSASGKVWVEYGTPQWSAWEQHLADVGLAIDRPLPSRHGGASGKGLWLESEWPPGHVVTPLRKPGDAA